VMPVNGTRDVSKDDMAYNDFQPENIDIDPQTFEVAVDGEPVTCEPADDIPLAQRYFL